MTTNDTTLAQALERVFHEPNRLAIMSALCAADSPLAFTELRETCGLTDGNLNRHLKVLEESGAVAIEKAFVDNKPRTTVGLTRDGLDRFQDYLDALSSVLKTAQKKARGVARESSGPVSGLVPAHAR